MNLIYMFILRSFVWIISLVIVLIIRKDAGQTLTTDEQFL